MVGKQRWQLLIVLLIGVQMWCGGKVSAANNFGPAYSSFSMAQPMRSGYVDSLFYLSHQPAKINQQTRLLVVLHGYGSNERDLISLSSELPKNLIVVSPRAPFQIGARNYQWYDSHADDQQTEANDLSESEDLVVTLIHKLQTRYKIPVSRTYVAGFSQGASMSYVIGLKHPDLVSGIGIWSGLIFPWLKKSADTTHHKPSVFIGHGDQDNRVNPNYAQEADNWLKTRKYRVAYHVYKGMHHEIRPQELIDFKAFLLQ